MTQLAGGNAVDYDREHRRREGQTNTQGVEGAAFCLISLINHQVVESTAQAGNQRQHEDDYQDF